MKYKKVDSWKVFSVLVTCDLDIMCPLCGIINLVNIASMLGTSRYQVKKHMDYLVRIGVAERDIFMPPWENEVPPPYHGYRLTEAVKYKGGDNIPAGVEAGTMLRYRAYYQKRKADNDAFIKRHFGA